jgi:hypothetical protein
LKKQNVIETEIRTRKRNEKKRKGWWVGPCRATPTSELALALAISDIQCMHQRITCTKTIPTEWANKAKTTHQTRNVYLWAPLHGGLTYKIKCDNSSASWPNKANIQDVARRLGMQEKIHDSTSTKASTRIAL